MAFFMSMLVRKYGTASVMNLPFNSSLDYGGCLVTNSKSTGSVRPTQILRRSSNCMHGFKAVPSNAMTQATV